MAPLTVLTVLALFVVHLLVRPHLKVRARPPAGISRYAIPIRAACVAALVGIVTGLSEKVGPQWSGILAGLPIILSSLIIILHMPTRRRPSLTSVLFWSGLTVVWWAGLCLFAGRPVWFW